MFNFSGLAASRRAALLTMAAACVFGATGVQAKSAAKGTRPTAYAGVVTGNLKAGSSRTLYILFDPLCGGCRQLYQQLLNYDSRYAFKWLPVNVLRPGARTDQMAASVLVGGTAGRANLKTVMAGGVPKVTVTQQMRNQLRQNEAFLRSVNRNAGRRVVVPTMLRADGSFLR